MTSHITDDLCSQAALYVLGVLSGEDLALYKHHLEQGCPTCKLELNGFQQVADQLSYSAPSVLPPASIRSTLLQRIKNKDLAGSENQIRESKTEVPDMGLTIVKASEESWQDIMPGIRLKPLFVDKAQGRMTALARMAPNTHYAAHRHTTPEEFYILEGTCNIDGQLLYPGDYHRAETGSIHYDTSTQDGCLMLIIFSPNNEMLDHV